jgi:hypothetical protein
MVPSDLREGPHRGEIFARLAAVHLRSALTRSRPTQVLKEMYGGHPHAAAIEVLLRGSASPAGLSTATWGEELASWAFADFLTVAVAPISAAATLIGRGLVIPMQSRAAVVAPAYVPSSADAGNWIAEGDPIPVRALKLENFCILTPKKLAVINTVKRELAASSNIEGLLRSIIASAMAQALDATMFSSDVGTDVKPPGLLNGVVALGAKAGGVLRRSSRTASR